MDYTEPYRLLTYKRVLPRDLFNESKLLKVLGFLTMWIEDQMDFMEGVSYIYDTSQTSNFICGQDQSDGAFFCKNVKFYLALDVELEILVYQDKLDPFSAFAKVRDSEWVKVIHTVVCGPKPATVPTQEFIDLIVDSRKCIVQ